MTLGTRISCYQRFSPSAGCRSRKLEWDPFTYNQMTRDERRKTMFELDREQIFKSDVFLFVLDGRIPDEGACVEFGDGLYTSADNRFLHAFQTGPTGGG